MTIARLFGWKTSFVATLIPMLCLLVLIVRATPLPKPAYITLLQFDDGSLEVCPTHGYQINDPFPYLTVQATTCLPDLIFANGFEP
jgi:hypothetical protein